MFSNDILKRVRVGTIFADMVEGAGKGTVTQMSNSWIIIKWGSLGHEWGTRVSDVVSSVLRGEWVIFDGWCSQIVIPNKNKNEFSPRFDEE